MNKPSFPEPLSLGQCTLDFGHNRIRYADEEVSIEPLVMQVLAQLCRTPGALVSHDTLVNEVWGSEYGTQERLVRAISVLRKVFRASGQEDGFIETIPKRGYRLTQLPVVAGTNTDERAKIQKGRHSKTLVLSVLSLVLVALAVVALVGIKPAPLSPNPEGIHLVISDFEPLGSSDSRDDLVGAFVVELKTALAEVPGLSLIDAESSAPKHYRLNGHISNEGPVNKIFVQLIRVADGKQVWAESFWQSGDPHWLEQAQVISHFLQVRLGLGIGAGRVDAEGIDAEAYEHYLRGIALWAERKEPSARRKAIVSLRLAVETQPDFADAWARYGIALTLSHFGTTGLNRDDVDRSAEDALSRALELESNNVRAHIGLSAYALRREVDVVKAEYHARQAINLSPETAEAHYVLAMTLLALGKFQDAHLSFDRAIALDSQNVIPRLHKMASLAGKGDVDALQTALNDCERCSTPEYQYLRFVAALQSGSLVRAQEAIDVYERSAQKAIQGGASKDSVSNRQEFEDLIEIFLHGKAQEIGTPDWVQGASSTLITACVFAQIGEHEQAQKILAEMHANSAFIETFELVSHGGPLGFSQDFLKSEGYKDFWSSSDNMKELLKLRKQNKRTVALPID